MCDTVITHHKYLIKGRRLKSTLQGARCLAKYLLPFILRIRAIMISTSHSTINTNNYSIKLHLKAVKSIRGIVNINI